ncbi:MAG TPA: type IV toxin-antitoxin system AbiEi family antitoxin domain-containing protein [Solirubrobacterales bacterium]|nr:type IV toxin-antitoxin system AbiEi family antitoxin domain-containing protein [Solirubrobacterales bacterium]
MGASKREPRAREAWELARRQHWVVTHRQLLDLGMTPKAVRHRLKTGRLRPVMRGVYAVGRPELSERGHWMAAVLASGPEALLSHDSAAALWGIHRPGNQAGEGGPAHVIVTRATTHRRPGVRMHRRLGLRDRERREVDGIPVTDPISTIVDIAPGLSEPELERAVNEACQLGLVSTGRLCDALGNFPRRNGVGKVRRLLERDGYAVTDTHLEQRFLPIAHAAGLPAPDTQVHLNGYRVDFYWPDLGLVVEADSLRYHRTAAKQAADHRRDQAHTAAGLTPLRFTHRQVFYEPDHVRHTLEGVAGRLRRRRQ